MTEKSDVLMYSHGLLYVYTTYNTAIVIMSTKIKQKQYLEK